MKGLSRIQIHLFEKLLVELVADPDGNQDGADEEGEGKKEDEDESGCARMAGAHHRLLSLPRTPAMEVTGDF